MQTLCPKSGLRTSPNWSKIRKMAMTSQFFDMTSSSIFFDVVLFLLSSLVAFPSFMSISSLVLELWQFSFIRDWAEIRKSEIPLSEVCPISEDWGRLWIPNWARMFTMTAFTVFELLRENQMGGWGRGGKIIPSSPPTRIRIKMVSYVQVIRVYYICFFSSPS